MLITKQKSSCFKVYNEAAKSGVKRQTPFKRHRPAPDMEPSKFAGKKGKRLMIKQGDLQPLELLLQEDWDDP